MTLDFGRPLRSASTPIPDLLVIDLPVYGDARGWFKENWQREKMVAAGIDLPDFGPVQNNISFNDAVGTTRGIHAEPWDKYVSVATGRVFGAWVDLREGETFGVSYSTEIDPGTAVFVPRGVGNSYQTLEPDTAYTYLVNDHWSPEASYTFLNLADETDAMKERYGKNAAGIHYSMVHWVKAQLTSWLSASGHIHESEMLQQMEMPTEGKAK